MNNILRIFVLFAAILVISCSSEANNEEKDTTKTNETAQTKEKEDTKETSDPGIFLENYNKVKDGMDLSSVEKLLSKNHYRVSSSGSGDSKTETYTWEDGPKTISITFVGGEVAHKVQSGL